MAASTGKSAADLSIEQTEGSQLSLADQESFAQALQSPPPSSPALKRAFERRSKLLAAPNARTRAAMAEANEIIQRRRARF